MFKEKRVVENGVKMYLVHLNWPFSEEKGGSELWGSMRDTRKLFRIC